MLDPAAIDPRAHFAFPTRGYDPRMALPVIRRANPTDAEIVARFNAAMAEETEGRPLPLERVLSGVRRALADEAMGAYFIAELDGRAVGQMLITREWSDWRDGWFWWIQSVYVAPEARRTGVYRALHEYVEKAARSTPDVCGLRLYVDSENTSAQRVYERLGMTRTDYQLFEVDWGGGA